MKANFHSICSDRHKSPLFLGAIYPLQQSRGSCYQLQSSYASWDPCEPLSCIKVRTREFSLNTSRASCLHPSVLCKSTKSHHIPPLCQKLVGRRRYFPSLGTCEQAHWPLANLTQIQLISVLYDTAMNLLHLLQRACARTCVQYAHTSSCVRYITLFLHKKEQYFICFDTTSMLCDPTSHHSPRDYIAFLHSVKKLVGHHQLLLLFAHM